MNKTLKISFSLKNTYRVNGVLFSLKQIPLVKRLLPATLYQVKGLKIFANILSVLWEIVSVFLGKFLYFITMVCGIGILYNGLPENEVFLHILLILTVIGSFVNTHLFNPTKDKYYAMILMKMDARKYTLVNYFYSILKVVVGFLPFTILFGMDRGVPLWFCLLLPLCIAGMKLFAAAVTLWDYEKRGFGYNENKLSKYVWCCIALLLAAAYAPPAFGFALPAVVPMVIFLACIPLGMASITRLTTFRDYYAINKELSAGLTNQMDSTAQTKLIKQANEKKISADTSISSNRKGFEYLNELFIKRHKKILWNSTKKISYVCAFLVAAVLAGVYLLPEEKTVINEIVMTWLPYFVFIMYAINRGTNFTQALFMNCDHSLLTYSFYKQPSFILRLFQIRLREIMKNQRCSGARDRYRTGADPVCHRRDGQSAELCSAGCFHPVYEPVFLDSLPDDLLSAPALQCRDGAEKRHISDCFVSNLCRLFCSYAAAYADYDIWNNDDCFLCALQYCRQHFGIPLCAENL